MPGKPVIRAQVVNELLQVPRILSLGPGVPNSQVHQKLASLAAGDLFAAPVRDHDMAAACLSALWLYHDFLDESHSISQRLESTTGSYWHGIMHRREPDYYNSKYWFRRVGEHAVFADLCRDALAIASAQPVAEAEWMTRQSRWNPFDFVDLCQRAHGQGDELETLCQKVQMREWELLFDYCCHKATAT